MAPTATEQNRPIVISGPSGAGKSTILKKLFEQYPEKFGFSVSHTTRSPRAGEVDGKDYNFVTREDFEKLVSENGFIEHAQFGSNSYGTSVKAIETIAKQGRTCILDIEMEGVKQIRTHPQFSHSARFLYLSPPSPAILEQRLRSRGTDSEEAIQKRLAQSVKEMDYYENSEPKVYDKKVVNDEIESAYEEARSWIVEG